MLICLLIIVAGYALMFGAHGLAERLLRAALGLALIATVLPALVVRIGALSLGRGNIELPRWAGVAGLVLLLAGIGYFAWRAREFFRARTTERERRSSAPRERVAPPPPMADEPRAFEERAQ
ncbi:MAG: hypothetical protein JWO36_2009 [Myxococcales bacterium]|nr:hypothetical protein [Myxococcales bacterium]